METALEHILISASKEEMISYLETYPEDFGEAIKIALSDKYPHCWRAASLLWSSMKKDDHRIEPHIDEIISVIASKNDGHQRELLKVLLSVQLDESHEGIVFDLCMTIWEQINKKPSVRHTAFMMIMKIVKKHPDLSKEILFLTQDHYLNTLSPGVKHSIIRITRELEPSSDTEEE